MGHVLVAGRFPRNFDNMILTVVSLQAFRNINAVTVPKMVGVPKNDEEDAARGNQ